VALYGRCIDMVVSVSSPKVAEMVKLLENTFRSVNIALVNEMAMLCDSFGIDVWEVIDAAATKPFASCRSYPGPGLGGHCIPVDPQYLTWKARAEGLEPRFIELAGQINSQKPAFVVSKVQDFAERPLQVAQGLQGPGVGRRVQARRRRRARVAVHRRDDVAAREGRCRRVRDPFVPSVTVAGLELNAVEVGKERVAAADVVIMLPTTPRSTGR